ncbi:hypothetical protein F4778DRAFT_154086 [Xylariomycetidae sp. FL2044]|nr:hypothetical protein F4778DRAFT_154086 [Xylariomycetidae sp. FL2044]
MCRNCDAEGHRANECPEPRNMEKVQCRNCDEYGHESRQCPKPRDCKCRQTKAATFPSFSMYTDKIIQTLESHARTAERRVTRRSDALRRPPQLTTLIPDTPTALGPLVEMTGWLPPRQIPVVGTTATLAVGVKLPAAMRQIGRHCLDSYLIDCLPVHSRFGEQPVVCVRTTPD